MMAQRRLMIFLSVLLLSGAVGGSALVAAQDQPPPPPPSTGAGAAPPGGPPPAYTQQSPDQLQQLVAPIALYPDSLVAQILAAATFPEQVVEADRWVQGNAGLQGPAVAQAANDQPWDASVKALTAFPAVLGNMDKNLSWTSSLGDAYYNQPQDVMAAVQVMRQRAQAAGNLNTTPQQVVAAQGSDISIQPANPSVVYVPAYDPWAIYGAPIYPWPGWYAYPGIWYAGPYLSFGIGLPIAFFGGFAWGWNHWGFDWGRRYPVYGGRPWISRSTTFYNRGSFYGPRGGFGARPPPGRAVGGRPPGPAPGRPGGPGPGAGRPPGGGSPAFVGRPTVGSPARPFNSPDVAARPFNGSVPAARGFTPSPSDSGMRSGAFSGFDRGGDTRGFSGRGGESFGGGGGARGGGGHGR
jgi:Protein of unknown function (DUF3300)